MKQLTLAILLAGFLLLIQTGCGPDDGCGCGRKQTKGEAAFEKTYGVTIMNSGLSALLLDTLGNFSITNSKIKVIGNHSYVPLAVLVPYSGNWTYAIDKAAPLFMKIINSFEYDNPNLKVTNWWLLYSHGETSGQNNSYTIEGLYIDHEPKQPIDTRPDSIQSEIAQLKSMVQTLLLKKDEHAQPAVKKQKPSKQTTQDRLLEKKQILSKKVGEVKVFTLWSDDIFEHKNLFDIPTKQPRIVSIFVPDTTSQTKLKQYLEKDNIGTMIGSKCTNESLFGLPEVYELKVDLETVPLQK